MRTSRFRWILALIMFIISFTAYIDRVILSAATPSLMQEFGFTKVDVGLLQTLFFAGYALMQIPGGMLAEFFRHRRIVAIATLCMSVFTVFTGLCQNFFAFALVRTLVGIGEGPLFPALSVFISRWFHDSEKAKASAFMSGGAFVGPMLGSAFTVLLIMTLGWRSVFYILGVLGVALSVLWYLTAYNHPAESRFANEAEKNYIIGGNRSLGNSNRVAPWKHFLKSRQFWAIGIQYFITAYIMYVYLSWLPLYLMEAQHFSLAQMGIGASLPWVALFLVNMGSAFCSDHLVAKGIAKNKCRSWFAMTGLGGCAIFMYFASQAATPWINVLYLSLSLGSLGLTFSTSWPACMDLGGVYSGSVAGWMNFCGNIGGVVAPIATAWIATNYGWQFTLLATAGSAVIGILAWLAVEPDLAITPATDKKTYQEILS
ncbi:MAG: MFS transporter [Sporomusaceae bacterium]|nr:MFS transporter [Sporomusaceae bacterium]